MVISIAAHADKVILKNGNVLRGDIIKNTPDFIVLKLRLEEGMGETTVYKDTIDRIESELGQASQFVTEQDGGGFELGGKSISNRKFGFSMRTYPDYCVQRRSEKLGDARDYSSIVVDCIGAPGKNTRVVISKNPLIKVTQLMPVPITGPQERREKLSPVKNSVTSKEDHVVFSSFWKKETDKGRVAHFVVIPKERGMSAAVTFTYPEGEEERVMGMIETVSIAQGVGATAGKETSIQEYLTMFKKDSIKRRIIIGFPFLHTILYYRDFSKDVLWVILGIAINIGILFGISFLFRVAAPQKSITVFIVYRLVLSLLYGGAIYAVLMVMVKPLLFNRAFIAIGQVPPFLFSIFMFVFGVVWFLLPLAWGLFVFKKVFQTGIWKSFFMVVCYLICMFLVQLTFPVKTTDSGIKGGGVETYRSFFGDATPVENMKETIESEW